MSDQLSSLITKKIYNLILKHKFEDAIIFRFDENPLFINEQENIKNYIKNIKINNNQFDEMFEFNGKNYVETKNYFHGMSKDYYNNSKNEISNIFDFIEKFNNKNYFKDCIFDLMDNEFIKLLKNKTNLYYYFKVNKFDTNEYTKQVKILKIILKQIIIKNKLKI